jgi:hypothetical protein
VTRCRFVRCFLIRLSLIPRRAGLDSGIPVNWLATREIVLFLVWCFVFKKCFAGMVGIGGTDLRFQATNYHPFSGMSQERDTIF